MSLSYCIFIVCSSFVADYHIVLSYLVLLFPALLLDVRSDVLKPFFTRDDDNDDALYTNKLYCKYRSNHRCEFQPCDYS
jgi:hypothetical protein